MALSVIPAKAGIQFFYPVAGFLDSGSCPPLAGSPE
jgi:hypothetical protein